MLFLEKSSSSKSECSLLGKSIWSSSGSQALTDSVISYDFSLLSQNQQHNSRWMLYNMLCDAMQHLWQNMVFLYKPLCSTWSFILVETDSSQNIQHLPTTVKAEPTYPLRCIKAPGKTTALMVLELLSTPMGTLTGARFVKPSGFTGQKKKVLVWRRRVIDSNVEDVKLQ